MGLKSLVKVALLTIGVGSGVILVILFGFAYFYRTTGEMSLGYIVAALMALYQMASTSYSAIVKLRSGVKASGDGASLLQSQRIVNTLVACAIAIGFCVWSGVPFADLGWVWDRSGTLVAVGIVAGVAMYVVIYRRLAQVQSVSHETISLSGKRDMAVLAANLALIPVYGALVWGSLQLGVLSQIISVWVLLPLLGLQAFLILLPRDRTIAILSGAGMIVQLALFVLTGSILTPIVATWVGSVIDTFEDIRHKRIVMTPADAPAAVPATVQPAAATPVAPASSVVFVAPPMAHYLVAGFSGALVARAFVVAAFAVLRGGVDLADLPYIAVIDLPIVLVIGGVGGWLSGRRKITPALYMSGMLTFMSAVAPEALLCPSLPFLERFGLSPEIVDPHVWWLRYAATVLALLFFGRSFGLFRRTIPAAATAPAADGPSAEPVGPAHPAVRMPVYLAAGIAGAVVGRVLVDGTIALLVPTVDVAAMLPYYLAADVPFVLVVGSFAGWLFGRWGLAQAALAAAYPALMASAGVEVTTAYALKYLKQWQLIPPSFAPYFWLELALSLAGGVLLIALFGLFGRLFRHEPSTAAPTDLP